MKFINKNILILLFCLLFISIFSCDNILPQQYQEAEEPTVPEIDQEGYNLLTRELVLQDTVINGNDTTYNDIVQHHKAKAKILRNLMLTDTSIIDSSDSYIINSEFSSLSSQLDTIYSDTTILIKKSTPEEGLEEKNHYTFFDSNENGIINCYITWEFTEANIDNYIGMDFYDSNGERCEQHPLSLSLETINEYTEIDTLETTIRAITKIRSKLRFSVNKDSYLVRFHISEPTVIDNFRLVLLYEENNNQ
ncbi:MAG: hypothetical protein K9M80_08630 [Candidatus Marinimicrobia bacterium]|nr:hypothetical protein [Candidatus Neomarinimicrobiota bacterium]